MQNHFAYIFLSSSRGENHQKCDKSIFMTPRIKSINPLKCKALPDPSILIDDIFSLCSYKKLASKLIYLSTYILYTVSMYAICLYT